MAESKMADMVITRRFCDYFFAISENVQVPKLYQVSCFYEKVNISSQILHLSPATYGGNNFVSLLCRWHTTLYIFEKERC